MIFRTMLALAGIPNAVFLGGSCHPGEPSIVAVDRDTGTIAVFCAVCSALVITFAAVLTDEQRAEIDCRCPKCQAESGRGKGGNRA